VARQHGLLPHDEQVIDEALEETFPASDPPLPVRPGSSMALRYIRWKDTGQAAGAARWLGISGRNFLILLLVCTTVAFSIAGARLRRHKAAAGDSGKTN
jgi:hypothetical protein